MKDEPLAIQPTACMWCGAYGPDVKYDRSHVIPESCGNDMLILPRPIVCKPCNHSFRKIEQPFAREPEFNFKAALLGLKDPRSGKPFRHDRYGIIDSLPPRRGTNPRHTDSAMEVNLHNCEAFELTPRLTVDGVQLPLRSVADAITPRWLRFYSRAVHKIAFEWYAYLYHVKGWTPMPFGAPTEPHFDQIRAYVRRGQPQFNARTFLRWHETIDLSMEFHAYEQHPALPVHINLLGTHYVLVLIGDNDSAGAALTPPSQLQSPVLVFDEKLTLLGPASSTTKSSHTF